MSEMPKIQTFEEYINQLIKDGYMAENGTPLKCGQCEGKDFEEYDHEYLDYTYGHGIGLLEYKLKCKSCGKNVGYWATGNWQV